MRTVLTKILPHALYGVEHSNPPEGLLKKLATAIMRPIGTVNGRKDIDLIFHASQLAGKDLDPTIQIADQRVMGLRRATARRQDIQEAVGEIIEQYAKIGAAGANRESQGEDADPAPHPNQASRTSWMNAITPKGPIGFLLQSLHLLTAGICVRK